jgi:signal peptidase I
MPTALRIARLSAVLALLLAAVWLLLPTSLGGSTTYVSTYGTSMEPAFGTGDLAILRPSGSYDVGDVVAYRSDALETTVMHRIVDRDGDRFVTQGDDNTWLDDDRPSADQLLGAVWLRVPQGGKALAALGSPAVLAVISIAIAAVMGVLRGPRRRGGGSRRGTAALAPPRLSAPAMVRVRRAAIAAGAIGVLTLTGASALLLLPDEQTTTRSVPVTQQGRFTYSAGALPGTTYPDGSITTGEPIYTALASALTVSFEHSLVAGGALDADGTVHLALSLTAPDGWTTELTTGVPALVQGATATATVQLDTAAAAGLLAAHYYEVGIDAGTATLTVTPVVDVDGTVDGRPFTLAAPTPLAFTLEPIALRLAGGPETLESSAGTTVTVEEVGPRVFALGAATLPIETARALALGVALAALLVAVTTSWLGGRRSTGPADEFVLRHAGRVLPVAAFLPEGTIVDVTDPEALYKVAQRIDGLVLHHAGPEGDTFAVRDVGTTYRCVLPRPPVVQRAPRRAPSGRLVRRFA